MNRCCRDTITHHAPKHPVAGTEIACRWCTGYFRWEQIGNSSLYGWMPHNDSRTHAFVTREANPLATEARELAYQRILGRERQR